jgi:hypothetical protein
MIPPPLAGEGREVETGEGDRPKGGGGGLGRAAFR